MIPKSILYEFDCVMTTSLVYYCLFQGSKYRRPEVGQEKDDSNKNGNLRCC